MADYSIAAVTRRAVYTGSAGTGPYSFTFALLATSDIAVYKNATKLTETSDYTVTLSSSTGQGSVTLDSAASSSDTITLVGSRALARTTDFVTAGSLTASALNTDLDSLVIFAQQLSEENSRNLKAPVTEGISGTTDMTIPPKATRASKMLEFDSDGNPAVSIPATNLAALGAITANITTVAGVASNVTTVAGIASNITAVAGDATDIGAVAAVATEIGRLGTSAAVADLAILGTSAIVTDMDLLATSANVAAMGHLGTSANVTAMGLLGTSTVVADMALLGTSDVVADMALLATSDVIADMNTLATSDIISDINTLATSDIVADLNTLATSDIVSDINTLATSDIVSDLNTLATSDIVSDINTLATSDVVTDLNLLATSDFVSDLNTLATSTNVANIATVASNVAGVNSFAERYRIGSSDPSSSLDEGDLNYNTSDNALKYFNGSAWVAIAPGIANLVEDTTPQLGGNLASNGNDIIFADNDKAIFGAGSDLQIFHDGSDSYVKDAGTGRLVVETDGTDISLKAGSDNMLVGAKDGAVTLYYDNAAKLATTATGVDVTGVITTDGMTTSANINFGDNDKALFGAGDDLQVYHDGSDSYVKDAGTGRLVIETNGTDVSLKSGSDNMLVATKDGSVELYHNGVKQLETTANGVQLTGATTETKTLEIGTGRSGDGVSLIDLTGDATYTDFGTRLIRNAGANAATELVHRGTGILALVAQDAGRIEFKVANTEKMRIDADGVTITDADNSQPRVIIKTTDAGSGSPFLDFIKDSASPADDDNLMVLRNLGDNDAGEVISYVTMVGRSSDVTDGTENGRLSFETYVDGTNAERMAINSDGSTNIVNARIGGSGTVSSTGSWTGSGDVVLHTTSPSLNLGAFGVVVSHTYRGVFFTNSLWNVYDENNTGVHLVGGQTSWTANSDERIKKNITELNGSTAYNHVKAARAVTFNWKQEDHDTKVGKKIGFIAQDWETNYSELIEESLAAPQLVEEIDGIEDNTKIKGMQYTETIPVLMAALKEAIAKIEVLEAKVTALES